MAIYDEVTFVGLPPETPASAAGNPLETFSPADFRNRLEEHRLALGVPSTPGLSTREEDWEEYRNAFRSGRDAIILPQSISYSNPGPQDQEAFLREGRIYQEASQSLPYSAIANAMAANTLEHVNSPPLEYLAALPLPNEPATPRAHKYDFEFNLP